MRKLVLALSAAAAVLPALAIPTAATARHYEYREWQGQDGRYYCRRSDGTTGTIVGAVGGALVGRTIDTRGDRTLGTLGGAAIGALAGRAIERSSTRHCE